MNRDRVLHISKLVAALLFISCIPIFLLTSSLCWAVNDLRLYQYGFDKYQVSSETGFTSEELTTTAKGLINYFNSGDIDSSLSIFSEREMAHLHDVRGLIHLCYALQFATLCYIVVFIASGCIRQRLRFLQPLCKLCLSGSVLSIALVAVVGIAALIDFDRLFMAFHRLFFTGDTFVLNGYLPVMFTEDFFADAAEFVVIAIVVEAIILGIVTGGLLLRDRRKQLA